MIISIDMEKVLGKIQHPLIIIRNRKIYSQSDKWYLRTTYSLSYI